MNMEIKVRSWEDSVSIMADLVARGDEDAGEEIMNESQEWFSLYRLVMHNRWEQLTEGQKARVVRADARALALHDAVDQLAGIDVRRFLGSINSPALSGVS